MSVLHKIFTILTLKKKIGPKYIEAKKKKEKKATKNHIDLKIFMKYICSRFYLKLRINEFECVLFNNNGEQEKGRRKGNVGESENFFFLLKIFMNLKSERERIINQLKEISRTCRS